MLCEIDPEPANRTVMDYDTSSDSFYTARSCLPPSTSLLDEHDSDSSETTKTVQFVPANGRWSLVRPAGYTVYNNVFINGVLRYTLEKNPHYLHRWSLKNRCGDTVATFRAGKVGSWLEIQVDGRSEVVPRRFSVGNGAVEWGERYSLLSSDVSSVRWRREDHSMVMINNRVLRLPPVALLAASNYPTNSAGKMETAGLANHSWLSVLHYNRSYKTGFTVHWRCLDQEDVILERIVVCTAMIAHWKWSRKLDLVNRASNLLSDPVITWLERNLERGPRMVPLAKLITRHPALKRLKEQSNSDASEKN